METFSFTPYYDLPLLLMVVALLVWHFHYWSHNTELDSNADLVGRFPLATTKAVVLLVVACFLCWAANFAFWGIFALLLLFGIAISIALGGDAQGSVIGLLGPAIMLREWAFGFPQLILDPKKRNVEPSPMTPENAALIGEKGISLSPLRPMGDIDIGGEILSATSDSGQLIDAGTNVTVIDYRNGQPRVIPTQ